MDDFNLGNLQESKNEWCVRLLNILTPPIRDGIQSIFISARKLCIENKEPDKYLLTFQNLLTRVPQWNPEIISNEVTRILKSSNCTYLEDLITCVHIIQLKLLTYARVGVKYKKLDLTIPKLNEFVHKIYINCARIFYQQAFLFKTDISPIDVQKNNVHINQIIKECIMTSVRDSIPFELIVRSYLDNTQETFDEIKESPISEPTPITPPPHIDAVKKYNDSELSKEDQTQLHTIIKNKVSEDVLSYTPNSIPPKSLDGGVSQLVTNEKETYPELNTPLPIKAFPKEDVNVLFQNTDDTLYKIKDHTSVNYSDISPEIYTADDMEPPNALLDCIDL